MKNLRKYTFALLLLGAACSQGSVWQSACACSFNLSEQDLERAQIVALEGDAPAIDALIKHYGTNGPHDLERLWTARRKSLADYREQVRVARYVIKASNAPDLASGKIRALNAKGSVGEASAVEQLAKYYAEVRMVDEANVWKARLDSLDQLESRLRTISAKVKQAQEIKNWERSAPLIEAAYADISNVEQSIYWVYRDFSGTNKIRSELFKLVKPQYLQEKRKISLKMCEQANLYEPVTEKIPGWTPDMGSVYGCDYARPNYVEKGSSAKVL